MVRCHWAQTDLSIQYHDQEWGVPLHDDTELFAFLVLEGAQAGLNWEIILKKRPVYYQVYDGFQPDLVAVYDSRKLDCLLLEPGIVRNKRKIYSSIQNARVFVEIQHEFGSFDHFIWDFVNRNPIQNNFSSITDVPAQTPLSAQISLDLRKRGMNFVGPTIMYAFMQAVGMVNDHLEECFRHQEVKQLV